MDTETAYIGLGANLGNREETLAAAAKKVRNLPGVELLAISQAYYTEPQGVKDQPWFVNRAAAFACGPSWSPGAFLEALLRTESELGRRREDVWGPRVVDLDLLLYGARTSDEPELKLPHPRIGERAFVLVPLLEIAPDIVLPTGERARDLLAGLRFTRRGNLIWQ
jgi:2-amino-4-hydroxy-6-hydroxymethyldihydropteridine diphosphokinase